MKSLSRVHLTRWLVVQLAGNKCTASLTSGYRQECEGIERNDWNLAKFCCVGEQPVRGTWAASRPVGALSWCTSWIKLGTSLANCGDVFPENLKK